MPHMGNIIADTQVTPILWDGETIGYLAIHKSGNRAYGLTEPEALQQLKMCLMRQVTMVRIAERLKG